MKCLIVIVFVLIFSLRGYGTTYYFSMLLGNDTRSSTQAQNENTPWKTINKLNDFFPSLVQGDMVLFHRGETWVGETIIVSKSGTTNNPITIGAYGSGSKPVITLMRSVTFGSPTGLIYPSTTDLSDVSKCAIVMVNGVSVEMGRFPNSNAADQGYLTMTGATGSSSGTINASFPTTNYNGAELVIRKDRFRLARARITAYNGTTDVISYTIDECNRFGSGCTATEEGYGCFIQGHISTLDRHNEWFYNKFTKILYFYSTSTPTNVKMSTGVNYCVSFNSSIKNITFDNIKFEGADSVSIYMPSGNDNVIAQNCTIYGAGSDGLRSPTGINTQILADSFLYCQSNSIVIGKTGTDPTETDGGNAQIIGNYIFNSGSLTGMEQSGQTEGCGIVAFSKGAIIKDNVIWNSGYDGVFMGYLNDWQVLYNYVNTYCFVKDDGGGIYTVNSSDLNTVNRLIRGNVVENGVGAQGGTPQAVTSPRMNAQAIYLDNLTKGVLVDSNTMKDCQRCFFMNYGNDNITARANTVYNADYAGFFTDLRSSDPARNNRLVRNIYFMTRRYTWSDDDETAPFVFMRQLSGSGEVDLFGVIDSNFYFRPLLPTDTFAIELSSTYRTFSAWKSNTPYDDSSVTSTVSYANTTNQDSSTTIIINTTLLPITATALGNWNWVNLSGTTFNRNSIIPKMKSEVLIKTTYFPPDPPQPGENIFIIPRQVIILTQ